MPTALYPLKHVASTQHPKIGMLVLDKQDCPLNDPR